MKRDDLQGLRGLAIFAVLGFHFFPKIFPNGYIGVDMFFVLSGFLMTMIFGSKPITKETVKLFYWRRTKRILPLYLLIILIGCIFVFIAFPSTFIPINMDSAWNSIFLYHNMAEHSDNNMYFKMLNQAEDIFTHTWSLCVEMQFYVIAPFIFFALSYCEDGLQKILFHIFFIFASLGNYMIASDQRAFNSVFCRIWQFLIGSATFFICREIEEYDGTSQKIGKFQLLLENESADEADNAENSDVIFRKPIQNLARLPFGLLLYTSLNILIFVAFSNFTIQSTLLRVICTILTGTLIIGGTIFEHNAMNYRAIVYVGDISYSLYLIHWPIFVYIKFNYSDDWKVYILAISFSILLAIICSESYEKFYLKLGKYGISLLITIFYVAIIAVIINQVSIKNHIEKLQYGEEEKQIAHISSFENITYDKAVKLNKKWARDEYKYLVIPNCFPNKTEHGYCEFENSTLSGQMNTFLVGNSYTPNLGKVVYDTFGKNAKTMAKFSYSYCEVLTVNSEKRCRSAYNSYQEEVMKNQPDVLFIIDRPTKLVKPLSGNVTRDSIFLEALTTLRKFENMVKKKIYLLDSMTPPTVITLTQFAQLLEKKHPVSQALFKTDFSFMNGHQRLQELVKRCQKCELIDITSVLYNGNLTKNYDEDTKLGYYFDGLHLTPMALDVVTPVFQGISDRFN